MDGRSESMLISRKNKDIYSDHIGAGSYDVHEEVSPEPRPFLLEYNHLRACWDP